MEYVAPYEIVQCERCGCYLKAGEVTDKSYPLCTACQFNAK